ncbi:hypothetical protein [Roseburia sp. 499]|uniref:hypothetical protein n=1 Tax=Roseburia sp. 499 TaxID=1261634 RepID=UPI000951B6EB|nr:hypothetical protein [Roseburia sp. 499]WVK70865.1 hypothetical protein BIV20_04845 [Roseburia sp. 499]
MKKRIFALATALVMTLSMGMTAFAAESPTVTNSLAGKFAESATAVIDGQTVELDFDWGLRPENLTEAQVEQVEYYIPNEVLLEGDEEAERRLDEKRIERTRELFEKVMGYRVENVARKDFFGLALPEGYTMPAEGVDVTIDAPYAGKGDYTYLIFHCKADGTWEYIPTTEGDGTLSGRFTSFSPVFIMAIPKTNSTTTTNESTPVKTGTAATATTSTATAPKTGEFAGIYVAGMLAFLSVTGIVVYTKKNKIMM